jgi:hypothetical protein
MDWKPIVDAPGDGRVILARDDAKSPALVYWSDWLEGHWQPLAQPWTDTRPSHWAPVPD